MKKFHLDCAYIVTKFIHHDTIQHELLRLISSADQKKVIDNGCDTDIRHI